MSQFNAIVTVTGASGYIAAHIVKQLLEKGNILVRGTVRSTSDAKKTEFLKQLPGASERLVLFEADLLKDGSFDEAVSGADYVIHTASPFFLSDKIKNAQTDLIDPAVNGTKTVLESVNRAPSVKRVVLTSSCAAVQGDATDRSENNAGGHVFTEADWNETSSLTHGPYSYSKTLAERAAWDIVGKQNRWDLVTINPSFVMGPTLSGRNDTTSIQFIVDFLNGKLSTGVPDLSIGFVDVRDVAKAHIDAAFKPEAKGRYIVSPITLKMLEVANVLRPKFSQYSLPSSQVPKFLLYIVGPILAGLTWKYISNNVGFPLTFDSSKIKNELGFEFRDPRQALIDTADSIIEHNLITVRPPKN